MWSTHVHQRWYSGVTTTYRVNEGLNVFDAEAEGDDHGDTKETIKSDAPHHGSWKFFRSIFELFAHVCTSVRP